MPTSRALKSKIQPGVKGGERPFRDEGEWNTDAAKVCADIEATIVDMMEEEYRQATGALSLLHRDWDAFWAMYTATYQPEEGLDGPFADLHLAKVAPLADRLTAALVQHNLGNDEQSHDWFRAMPAEAADGSGAPDIFGAYATAQEAALRHCLIRSDFADTFALSMLDKVVVGNAFLMVSLEEEIRPKFIDEPNPLYALTDGQLAAYSARTGHEYAKVGDVVLWLSPHSNRWELVPKFKRRLESVRDWMGPKTTYLNPYNVFPDKLDRNGLQACSAVFLYDACDLADLQEDAIIWDPIVGACGNYANVDNESLGAAIDGNYVSAVYDRVDESGMSTADKTSPNEVKGTVRQGPRQTRYGRLEMDEAYDRVKVSPKHPGVEMFLDKFNADRDRMKHMKTFVIETVGTSGPSLLVRCQPNPYDHDSIPVEQDRLIVRGNETMGMGIYYRTELPERIHNHFAKSGLESAERLSNPPMIVHEDLIDEAQIQELGGIAEISPGQIFRAAKNIMATQIDPIRAIKLPSDALEFSRQAMFDTAAMIEEQAFISAPVAGGRAGENQKASEIKIAAGGVETMFRFQANRTAAFLARVLAKQAKVYAQFSKMLATSVVVPGEDGIPLPVQVPYEVWMKDVIWFAIGPQTIANKELLLEYYSKFGQVLRESGRLNPEELANRVGRLLGIISPKALVSPPPPPDPAPRRLAASFSVTDANAPPEVCVAVLNDVLQEKLPPDVASRWQEAIRAAAAVKNGVDPAEVAAEMPLPAQTLPAPVAPAPPPGEVPLPA